MSEMRTMAGRPLVGRHRSGEVTSRAYVYTGKHRRLSSDYLATLRRGGGYAS